MEGGRRGELPRTVGVRLAPPAGGGCAVSSARLACSVVSTIDCIEDLSVLFRDSISKLVFVCRMWHTFGFFS